MYKVASEVLPRQCQETEISQKGKAVQRLTKASLIVGRVPGTWWPSRRKCREYRLFALPRLHTPNEYLKSTLSTTNATLSGSMLFTYTRLDHAVVLLPHHQHGSRTHPFLLADRCHQHIQPNHSSTILSSPSRPLALTDWIAAPETRHLVLRSK